LEQTRDSDAYLPFSVTADLVVLEVREGKLCVLVVKRGGEPFKGEWALPGGFVDRTAQHKESLLEAAARELREETGLGLKRAPYLAQLGAYGDPGRDPRGEVVTVAHLVVTAHAAALHPGDDAEAVGWLPVERVLEGKSLAFDHARIITDAVERVQDMLQYTALGVALCGPRFSIANLRRVYEIVWMRGKDDGLDPGNFQKRMQGMPGLLQEAADQTRPGWYDELGLSSRPGWSRGGGSGAGPGGGEGAREVLPATNPRRATSSAAASSPAGPRPVLYEPGPLIRKSGYAAPLANPILDQLRVAPPANLVPRKRPPRKT